MSTKQNPEYFRPRRTPRNGRCIMTTGHILSQYKGLSSANQHTFDLWLRTNAIVGSMLGVAVVAMAIGGALGPGSPTALTQTIIAISSEQQELYNPPVGQIEDSHEQRWRQCRPDQVSHSCWGDRECPGEKRSTARHRGARRRSRCS
jgi:hypothetical protein